jgi:hypothetical protein
MRGVVRLLDGLARDIPTGDMRMTALNCRLPGRVAVNFTVQVDRDAARQPAV